jgi:hypothetical protein
MSSSESSSDMKRDYTRRGYLGAEDRALHRQLFEQWKNKYTFNGRLCDSVLFCNALEELTSEHGYSYTDVSEMLGVSVARVGQWMDDFGILGTPYGQGRLWDDKKNRFVVTGTLADMRALLSKKRREVARDKRIAPRKAAVAKVIRAFASANDGLPPLLKDLVSMLRLQPASGMSAIVGWVYGSVKRGRQHGYAKKMSDIYAEAGFKSRPDGRRQQRRKKSMYPEPSVIVSCFDGTPGSLPEHVRRTLSVTPCPPA